MRVYLVPLATDPERSQRATIVRLAALDAVRRHCLCDRPEDADLVVFTDVDRADVAGRVDALSRHPLVARHRHRCVLYDSRDTPWCALPGAYVSMPARSFDPQFQVAAHYVHVSLPLVIPSTSPTLLFSFIGQRSHRCRDRLLAIRHPRAVVEDTAGTRYWTGADADFLRQRIRHWRVLARSAFVLCPRGEGVSSVRLFETMAAGRVPVIISDGWVPPPGVPWDEFALRWPERGDPARLVSLLESVEAEASARGERARQAFDEWFGPSVAFHRLVEGLATTARAAAALRFPVGGIKGRAYWRSRAVGATLPLARRVRSLRGRIVR